MSEIFFPTNPSKGNDARQRKSGSHLHRCEIACPVACIPISLCNRAFTTQGIMKSKPRVGFVCRTPQVAICFLVNNGFAFGRQAENNFMSCWGENGSNQGWDWFWFICAFSPWMPKANFADVPFKGHKRTFCTHVLSSDAKTCHLNERYALLMSCLKEKVLCLLPFLPGSFSQ